MLITTLIAILGATSAPVRAAQTGSRVALAYVRGGVVTLADAEGNPLSTPGPLFEYGQGARLFWSANGAKLYIARDSGLYTTGTGGAAAVALPGSYGRTLTISQDGDLLYYLETSAPQPLPENPDRVAFALRSLPLNDLSGSAGQMAGYFGRFVAGAARADVNFAGVRYARDGGLLGPGRPNLWPTYGSVIFGTCCFPDPGLAMFDLSNGQYSVFDETFIPGAAALNLTRTHLAGPTTTGTLRVIDLITGGTRDYMPPIGGDLSAVERVAWSPDDTYLYFVLRGAPSAPLELTQNSPWPVDTRSANITIYRLNLVTSTLRELATRRDVYGVSALAATDRYVFAVVVDPNRSIVTALNNRQVRFDLSPHDPALVERHMPATHLWRIPAAGVSEGGTAQDLFSDVWGLAARPIR